ncbi:MAG TPA: NAD-dependent epimerase/dehydratase family protein [Terriglobales bacterium]|nr:NAD-dependent epimerase/dehydratase family protein [Terriglobales bacterium]
MSSISKPTVIITGVSGNLGQRLLPQLQDFRVVGVDLQSPPAGHLAQFERMDLGREDTCDALVQLLKKTEARAVVHLAFIVDPLQSGVLDLERMWQINVSGTARVMEAITEVNRHGGLVDTFIFPSSVLAYGNETAGPVREENPLGAHSLPYAIHTQEADDVVRFRAGNLGACTTYLLRPHIFTGASMQNFLVNALRGTAYGDGYWGRKREAAGVRFPMLLPYGEKYLYKRLQFVHVDDMARLVAHVLHRPVATNNLVVLNVACRGDAITYQTCAHLSGRKIIRLPGRWACRLALSWWWKTKTSAVPPEALPYLTGSYIMNTNKLKSFLGTHYEQVIRYTNEQAFKDCFAEQPRTTATLAGV